MKRIPCAITATLRMREGGRVDKRRRNPNIFTGEKLNFSKKMEAEEISVEETNRIRASLGLAPLQIESNETKSAPFQIESKETKGAPVGVESKETAPIKDVSMSEAKQRLARKRKLNAVLPGPTLADDRDDDNDSSIDWIKRVFIHLILRLVQRKTCNHSQSVYTHSYLIQPGKKKVAYSAEGLSVAHDLDSSLADGSADILVLKDSNVLDDEDDMLESVALAESSRKRENMKKRNAKGYSAYQDDGTEKKGLLYQYDNEEEDMPEYTIGKQGSVNRKRVFSLQGSLSRKYRES